MNWDAIGAIGEILGAIAVVISLMYLATQIRISNLSSRQSRTEDLQNQFSNWYRSLRTSDEMWTIWAKGCADDPSLSKNEIGRFRITIFEVTQIWARVEEQRQELEIDEWAQTALDIGRKQIVCTPGFAKFWEARKTHFPESFQKTIEEEMKLGHEYLPGGIRQE